MPAVVGVSPPDAVTATREVPEDVLLDGLPTSPAASPTWRVLSQQPEVRAGVLAALMDTAAAMSRQGDEAAQLLADLLTAQEVAAVTMYRSAADGGMRLVGQAGVPGDVSSPGGASRHLGTSRTCAR